MKCHSYKLYDLIFESEFPIAHLAPCQIANNAIADVKILNETYHPAFDKVSYQKDFGDLLFTVGQVKNATATLIDIKEYGKFFVLDGHTIWAIEYPDGHKPTFQSYLCSLAIANVLFHRGMFVLHASSVRTGDGAALILGESGAGKTTLTAAFAQSGFEVYAEDTSVIRWNGSTLEVVPGLPYMKLFENTSRILGLDWESMPRLFKDVDKRARSLQGSYCTKAAPVKSVFVLSKGNVDYVDIQNIIEPDHKINLMVDNIHYPLFFMGYDLDEVYSDIAIKMRDNIDFYSLVRSRSQNTLEVLIDLITKCCEQSVLSTE